MSAKWEETAAQSKVFCDGVQAALEAVGLPVSTGGRGRNVILTGRGVGMCELRFRLDRPAHLVPGQPWNADGDAETMVTRALATLAPGYLVTRSLTGRQTLLTVRPRVAPAALPVAAE